MNMNKAKRPPVYCLMGPTASGKTQLAIELVQRGPFEIVSVDSAQVYRGLDIGSGKPDAATLAIAPHRLIDIRDPAESYSAAEFRQDALHEIAEIHSRNRVPLLVGGTMMYFKALRDGLAPMPAADEEVRENILALAKQEGWQAVHQRLAEVDPLSAQRIHPNDPQRLQRALEVFEISGKPLSAFHAKDRGQASLPFTLIFLAIFPEERALLHERITTRLSEMLANGFVNEVKSLYMRGDLNPSLPALRSVGYRQIWDYLDGAGDYEKMQHRALVATRQLAKRQLTWLRSWPDLVVLDSEMPKILSHCLNLMKTDLT
jgi:tRNA dimethylallyltransferase